MYDMKLCKNCNQNEAVKYSKYTTGNFCSRKCARGYSCKENREEINEKIRKAVNKWNLEHKIIKLKYCISCNIEIHNRGKYCKECNKYSQNVELFKKLGVLETNLQISNQNALIKLSKEYFTDKNSLDMLKEKYGVMFNTVHFFFKKNGINLRDLSSAQKNAQLMNRCTPSVDPKYKSGRHKTWFGKEYYYRSSYEKRMMEILDAKKELYYYETVRILYDFNGEKLVHITDFYLPERNLIIETKGEGFQKIDKEKIEAKKIAILSEGYYFEMYGDKELKILEKQISGL